MPFELDQDTSHSAEADSLSRSPRVYLPDFKFAWYGQCAEFPNRAEFATMKSVASGGADVVRQASAYTLGSSFQFKPHEMLPF
jgi:hypothetical protein